MTCKKIFEKNNAIKKDKGHFLSFLSELVYVYIYIYTRWSVTGGTNGKGVFLREKISRKYRIKIFRLRLCFRENRL